MYARDTHLARGRRVALSSGTLRLSVVLCVTVVFVSACQRGASEVSAVVHRRALLSSGVRVCLAAYAHLFLRDGGSSAVESDVTRCRTHPGRSLP